MVSWRMVFGEVVAEIGFSRSPVNIEVLLLLSVSDPMETHVDGSCLLLFDGVVCKAGSGRVIRLDWGWRLRVAHVMQCATEDFGFLEVGKEGSDFGLRGRGDNHAKDAGGVKDRTVGCVIGV